MALASASLRPAANEPETTECLGSQAAVWLEEMIGQLPEKYRLALRWMEIDGLLQRGIADRLGLSLSGAKSRIQRGRQMLRQGLERCRTFEYARPGNVRDYVLRPDRTVCRDCDPCDRGT